jgi:drug/metabolite transporter (DMT)-like permease
MGLETGLLFAFLAMLSWGIGDFLIQKTTRKVGDVEALAFIGLIGAIGLLPFMANDFQLLFSFQNVLILLVLGVITFIVALFNFEALKKGKLSIVDVVLELELPITIVLGFLVFRETLSVLQLSIISLIFIGIVLMATKSFSHFKKGLEKGVLLAVIAAIGMGAVNFLTAASSKQISPLMAVWFPWVVFTILCIIAISKRDGLPKLIKNGLRFKWLVLAMGVFDTAAWIFYAFAVFGQEIAITTAITESYPAIAMLLGIRFNRERIKMHQCSGAALALISSFLLAMTI